MADFLLWIGLYNVLGVLILMAMHHEGIADFILRRSTEIIAEPYTHGSFGRMWLWWAATTNAFLGAVMLLSLRWPEAVQREVVVGVVAVYVVMWVVLLVGGRGPRFGRGVYVCHGLWISQIAWGGWALSGGA